MATLFPHQYRPGSLELKMNEPAVYKLHVGSKYFIWKGRYLKSSIEQNCQDIFKFRWNKDPTGHLFEPIVAYIRKAKVTQLSVEVIVQSEDPQQLLQVERSLLEAGRGDDACLNTIFEAHVPKWMQEELNKLAAKDLKPVKRKPIPASNKPAVAIQQVIEVEIPEIKQDKPIQAIKTDPGRLSALRSAFGKLKKS